MGANAVGGKGSAANGGYNGGGGGGVGGAASGDPGGCGAFGGLAGAGVDVSCWDIPGGGGKGGTQQTGGTGGAAGKASSYGYGSNVCDGEAGAMGTFGVGAQGGPANCDSAGGGGGGGYYGGGGGGGGGSSYVEQTAKYVSIIPGGARRGNGHIVVSWQ